MARAAVRRLIESGDPGQILVGYVVGAALNALREGVKRGALRKVGSNRHAPPS